MGKLAEVLTLLGQGPIPHSCSRSHSSHHGCSRSRHQRGGEFSLSVR